MSLLSRSLVRARRSLQPPRGSRGVTGQFDHLPLPLPYDIKLGLGNFLPPPALETVAVEYQLGLLQRLTDEVRYTEEEGASVTQTVIATAPHRHKTLAFNYASLALNNSFFLAQLSPEPADAEENAISSSLASAIRTDHGGLYQFKSAFSAAAMGMFIPGCVWFVADKYGSTSILPTFGPGTLLVRSRTYMAKDHETMWHQQPASPWSWDRNKQFAKKYLKDWGIDGQGFIPPVMDSKHLTRVFAEPGLASSIGFDPEELDEETLKQLEELETADTAEVDPNAPLDASQPPPQSPGNPPVAPGGGAYHKRFLHSSSRVQNEFEATPDFGREPDSMYATTPRGNNANKPGPSSVTAGLHAGEVLYPLFCISLQEHSWLSAGYGVWGKEAWLREFWSVINWRTVSQNYQDVLDSSKST
ncbi:Manganese superoxide dismutase [Mycena kentingensis (nom. inval.)]|nr:Manganese superoxide dismutase [Mycena kentingensis (nom. inval.)]